MTFLLDQSITFFPFTLWLYIEELLSFSMDVKTDFVCLLFEVKKTLLWRTQLISGSALIQSEILSDRQMCTFICLHLRSGQVAYRTTSKHNQVQVLTQH